MPNERITENIQIIRGIILGDSYSCLETLFGIARVALHENITEEDKIELQKLLKKSRQEYHNGRAIVNKSLIELIDALNQLE